VRELGERAREEQVARRGGRAAPGARHDRRHAAAQSGGVEDVVVDERRAVDELDGGRRAHEPLAVAVAGGEEDEQRAQALAARGDRRAGVLAKGRTVVGGELAQAPLDAREQARHVVAGGADDLGHGPGDRQRATPSSRRGSR
jgi:hypothetical protein